MKHSEQLNELATALSKAQGEIKGAVKDQENPFFKKSYADLESVWDACRNPLSKNGLSIIQTTDIAEFGTVLTTTLLHSSGQYISGTYPINPIKNDPQGTGSAITYARRYSLAAIVGIYPSDDDGESAVGRGDTQAPEIKNVSHVSKPSVDQEHCEHKWHLSKYRENEEWCSLCKLKRPKKVS